MHRVAAEKDQKIQPISISQPVIGEAEREAVLGVLDSGMLVQGPVTAQLEERFARIAGSHFAVAVSSGTAALHLALLAHGIGPGDEVITTPFTFIASVNSILYCGARPVFADIQPDSFNIDPTQVDKAITPRTRAILPVHLYGQACDLDALDDIARRHDLVLIQDAAQAIGATYDGQSLGRFGTACFSLYATKNIMAAEGGIVATNDEGVAEQVRLLRNHGMRRRYQHEVLGYNLRLSDLHAAIGLAQIASLSQFTEARRRNAAYLSQRLTSVINPGVRPHRDHVWHQYTVRTRPGQKRDDAVQRLAEAGVGTGVFYPIPAHHQPHVRSIVGEQRLPVAERAAGEVFSVPVHPSLANSDLEAIVREVNAL